MQTQVSTQWPKRNYTLAAIAVLLLLSFLLRVALVRQGGQFFFPDEERYLQSRVVVSQLAEGQVRLAVTGLTASADHMGFKVLGMLPAWVEYTWGENRLVPAVFFSLFSLLNIALVACIGLQAGASLAEALLAALLMALSTTNLVYARHLLPYDAAMSFAMLAVLVGVNAGTARSFWVGLLAFAAFVTYTGYWTLAGFALVCHVFYPSGTRSQYLRRAFGAAVGLLVPLMLLLASSTYLGNHLLASYQSFAQTIVQGEYAEGWRLPFEYLWHAEHGLLLLWMTALVYIWLSRPRAPRRAWLWLGGLLFVYGTLVLFSVVLAKFVVYGRLVRQMVPFFSLAAAFALYRLAAARPAFRWAVAVLLGAAVLQAGFNFRVPLSQTFPREFAAEAHRRYPDFRMDPVMWRYTSLPFYEIGNYRVENVLFIYPTPQAVPNLPGQLLISAQHPQAYQPYLYEGYTPLQRAAFRKADLTMRLYRVGSAHQIQCSQ